MTNDKISECLTYKRRNCIQYFNLLPCVAYKLQKILQAIYEKFYKTQDSYFHRCFRSLSFVSDGNYTTAWLIHLEQIKSYPIFMI
jgi:hypothetical protein